MPNSFISGSDRRPHLLEQCSDQEWAEAPVAIEERMNGFEQATQTDLFDEEAGIAVGNTDDAYVPVTRIELTMS